ncbi:MAG: hypothetical protein JHC87_06135 [Thermoleophilaceae bacterium]|nr:hypothetical protein [Thermoleophilaceae bacterium]
MIFRNNTSGGEHPTHKRMPIRGLSWAFGLGAVACVAAVIITVVVVSSGDSPARATILNLSADQVEAQLRTSGASNANIGSDSGADGNSPVAATDLGPRDSEEHLSFPEPSSRKSKKFAGMPAASGTTHPSDGVATEAEIRKDLRQLRHESKLTAPGEFRILGDGSVEAPFGAPSTIQSVVTAANEIAHFPYRWGGGHGSFVDNAYDCSGSLSYALAAGGMVTAPLVSGDLAKWGVPGPGKWLTVYAHSGHTFMYVGGLRYDTSGRSGPRGSRWQTAPRSKQGFAVRHWPGL